MQRTPEEERQRIRRNNAVIILALVIGLIYIFWLIGWSLQEVWDWVWWFGPK